MDQNVKVSKVRFNPLEGESYEIGQEGGRKITLTQAQSGQWVESPFSYTPKIESEESVTKPLQPKHSPTPVNQWKPVSLGSDDA